jgi:L-alanine-DL-glutamate epimerase-like enolase superfamily enzyme
MFPQISVRVERWLLSAPFRISRGVKTEAVVVVAEIRRDGHVGRGECVPYARYGETPESVVAQIESLPAAEFSRDELQQLLPPGAARNAVDCALWDLEAKRSGRSIGDLLGRPALRTITTAVTVSLDEPDAMAAATRRIADAPLIKVKVDASRPREVIEAVVREAPRSRLIVDPNESWSFELLRDLQPFLRDTGTVALVEQPLHAEADAVLDSFRPLVPICADESLHDSADLARLQSRYQVVNIKLDKTGGLTEALRLFAQARERGLGVMVGCMVCTSLGIAPALHLATTADFVDLDGPWWLSKDREQGVRIEKGRLLPPPGGLWGD